MNKKEEISQNFITKPKKVLYKYSSPNCSNKLTQLNNTSTRKKISGITSYNNKLSPKVTSFSNENKINFHHLKIEEFLSSKDLAMKPEKLDDIISSESESSSSSPKIKKKLFDYIDNKEKFSENGKNIIYKYPCEKCPFCKEMLKYEDCDNFVEIFFKFLRKLYIDKDSKRERCNSNNNYIKNKKHINKVKSTDFNFVEKQKIKKIKNGIKKNPIQQSKTKIEQVFKKKNSFEKYYNNMEKKRKKFNENSGDGLKINLSPICKKQNITDSKKKVKEILPLRVILF